MLKLFGRGKAQTAHMGEENKMYYNEELKRWVERGKEHEVVEDSLPPPPTAMGGDAAAKKKMLDEGNPASRYVAAGDFAARRSEAAQTDAKKSFVTPPKLAAPTPPTGEFFVPAAAQPTSDTAPVETSAPSQGAAKYKGYRIPTFIKPEGREGTQEEYEAEELRKFKAKIDKKEARKNGVSENKENGVVHDRPKARAKLEDSWLMESDSAPFESAPFAAGTATEMMHPQSPIDEVFGATQAPAFYVDRDLPLNGEGTPVELFPVEPESQPGEVQGFGQTTNEVQETAVNADRTGNHATESFRAEQPQAPEIVAEDGPIDFNSWDPNPDAQMFDYPSQAVAVDPAIVDSATAVPQQEAVEAEYPGAIRDSDDPFDIAWLMRQGWTDAKECLEVTAFLNERYQDSWRGCHIQDKFWDEFWGWYYDEGYEIIHSATQPQQSVVENGDPSNLVHSDPITTTHNEMSDTVQIAEDDAAAAFFNAGMELEMPAANQTEQGIQEGWDVDEVMEYDAPQTAILHPAPVPLGEAINEEPAPVYGVAEEAPVANDFVPESDEEFWKESQEEAVIQDVQLEAPMETAALMTEERPAADAAEHCPHPSIVTAQERRIACPVSNGKEYTSSSSKLSPWEDEFLFSLPDPWADSPTSEDGTDDGKLPFAVFHHKGMLHFLHELNDVLTSSISPPMTSDLVTPATQFQNKVKKLIIAVEMSAQGHPAVPDPMPEDLSDSLKLELQSKVHELDILRSEKEQKEIELNNKLDAAHREMEELRKAYDSMALRVKEQDDRMHELSHRLEQAEAELKQNKEQLEDSMAELGRKDSAIETLQAQVISVKNEADTLQQKLDIAEGKEDVIRKELSEEMENLKRENQVLKESKAAIIDEREASCSPFSFTFDDREGFQTELKHELMTSQKKILQQQKLLEDKEGEIARLMGSSTENGFSVNNEMEEEDWMERLRGKEMEIAELEQIVLTRDSKIGQLETELRAKTSEFEALSQMNHTSCHVPEVTAELESKERRIAHLEQVIEDKNGDVFRLAALCESVPKKDGLISKLTTILGEKDQELIDIRSSFEEGRRREVDLIEQLSAKDSDLENVVHSLMFSQQQVSRLCGYCHELGGDPHSLLSSLQVVE